MQQIISFWKTTTGKIVVLGSGGLAGLFFICFACTICSVFIGQVDKEFVNTNRTQIPPTAISVSPTNTIEPTTMLVSTTNTTEPTAILVSPTSTTESTSNSTTLVSDSGNGYLSGGLGLSQLDWEQKHTKTNLDYQPMGTGYDNKYDIMFQVGNVWHIEYIWGSKNPVAPDVVESESKNLIPSDSQFIETYSPKDIPELIVNLYFSESLKNRFNNKDSLFGNWWTGGKPGNFIVVYGVFNGKVSRMVIGIGNNP